MHERRTGGGTLSVRVLWVLGLTAGLLAACATPQSEFPSIETDASAAKRESLQAEVISARLGQYGRLQDLAWPLLTENRALCGGHVRASLGLTLADAKNTARLVGGLKTDQVRQAGWPEGLALVHVVRGGPAEEAGLSIEPSSGHGGRAVVTAVGGQPLRRIGDLGRLARRLRGPEPDLSPVTLTVTDATGASKDVSVTPEVICRHRIRMVPRNSIQAFTDGRDIMIHFGMLQGIDDDRLIQFVVGHELGHALSTPGAGKIVRNYFVSGAFVVGPVLSVGGAVYDVLRGVFGPTPARPAGAALSSRVVSSMIGLRDFEREADYLGLYLYARSGGSLEGIETIFAQLAEESPRRIWSELSHPTAPERMLAIGATRAEILAKLAAGEALVPIGFEPPGQPDETDQ